jgi:hypothetical protein
VSYATPAAFKQALEARLRAEAAATGRDLARVRLLLVFERFVVASVCGVWRCGCSQGGVVLELRLARARTTKDIDLRASGEPDNLLEKLREASAIDAGDWLRFLVRPDAAQPEMKGDGVIYDSRRFCVEAQLAGKLYGTAFGADIAMCDPIHGVAEELHGSELLAFHRPSCRVRSTRDAVPRLSGPPVVRGIARAYCACHLDCHRRAAAERACLRVTLLCAIAQSRDHLRPAKQATRRSRTP